ncbi:MAG: hypothetical protein R3E42_00260 [Burkholderiaceae bacterium]
MPEQFDLVVRNARVATASDVFTADIGVKGGCIAQLGRALAPGVGVRDDAKPGAFGDPRRRGRPLPPRSTHGSAASDGGRFPTPAPARPPAAAPPPSFHSPPRPRAPACARRWTTTDRGPRAARMWTTRFTSS